MFNCFSRRFRAVTMAVVGSVVVLVGAVVLSAPVHAACPPDGVGVSVDCAGDIVVRPGRTISLSFMVTNCDTVGYSSCAGMRGDRRWPVVLGQGPLILPGQASRQRTVSITVPDTAAVGVNNLTWQDGCAPVFPNNTCIQSLRLPELIQDVRAEAVAWQVRLVWAIADSSADSATVYRLEQPLGDWTKIGEVVASSNGELNFVDTSVKSETRYAYRLGLPVEQRQIYCGEIAVVVPRILGISLENAGQNPSFGAPAVSVLLSSNEPSTLEMIDIAGRILGSVRLDGGAGRSVVRLATYFALNQGLYFVRLRQSGSERLLRVAVVR